MVIVIQLAISCHRNEQTGVKISFIVGNANNDSFTSLYKLYEDKQTKTHWCTHTR